MKAASKVRVFFYGSFINRSVLAEVNLVPDRIEIGRLWGFDIRVEPLANLVASDQHCVYGIVCEATHFELNQLFTQSWVGLYWPYPVVVELQNGLLLPALCYLAPEREASPPTQDYIDRIVGPAQEYGFPDWYIARLKSFVPAS